jgi:putative ATP-dependent endonuclease of the OLD family
MKLTAIHIQNFRSVKDTSINDIDDFNVLIGKNNSGKSNLLVAINAFFKILSNGSLVSSQPGVGNLSDFTDNDSSNPISIAACFILSHDEITTLLRMMRDERPQIATALEALPHDHLSLFVRISIVPPPQSYSFVQNIALDDLTDESRNWVLLNVDPPSAEEMYKNYQEDRAVQRVREGFERLTARFDEDDWRRLRQGPDRNEPYLYRAMFDAAGPVSPEVIPIVRRLIEEAQSFEEFQTTLRDKIGTFDEDRRAIGGRRLATPIKTFFGIEDLIPTYVKALVQSIVRIKVLFLQERRRQIGAEEAQKILDLKMTRGRSATLTRIQRVVEQLLGVRIDAFRPDRPLDRPRPGERPISAEMDIDDFLVELNGSGIREALRLILDTTFEDPHILLVEEPEIHLHPGLETAMMRFLKEISQTSQIFITTHSTNFLDSGDYQTIYLVTKPNVTLVEALALKEVEERVPMELGIRLSSLFMYDRLVFVEGPSDELVIRVLCNTLDVNLSRGNVGFVLLRGIGNLAYYAAKETLGFLQKRNVELMFLIDRDERAEAEIASIKESLGAGVVFFPTEPRELENYLIEPSAIAGYIASRKDDGKEILVKDIESLLARKAEQLKGYTLWKHLVHHLRPVYPDRETPEQPLNADQCIEHFRSVVTGMQKDIEETVKGLDALHEKIWGRLNKGWEAGKMKSVPGSELLDEVFKEYGLRFVKLRDGPGLAAMLGDNAIDRELRGILRKLA